MEGRSENYWLRSRTTRRAVIRGAATTGLGATSLALVGCGDDDEQPSPTGSSAASSPTSGAAPTTAASPTIAAKQPKAGGAYTFAALIGAPTLDPYTDNRPGPAVWNSLAYSKLFRLAARPTTGPVADFTMEPDLATALPEQPDPLTLVIKLKPNVKFQAVAPVNGRALTSADVLYALDRYRSLASSPHKALYANVDKIDAPDAQTVRITTKTPWADGVTILGGTLGAWIAPKEIAESVDVATKMAGTGPYVLDEFKPQVSVSFKKNPDYFDKPYPYFDTVTGLALFTVGSAAAAAAFGTKQSNSVSGLGNSADRESVKKARPDAATELVPYYGQYIHMRTDKPPFNDKRVRQAISMALDRKAIRDIASAGEGVPDQVSFVGYSTSRQVKDLPQAKYWEQNIAEAKKLMAAAIGEGKTIETKWVYVGDGIYGQSHVDIFTQSQAQLKAIGINITPDPQPYNPYIANTYGPGNYEGMGHTPQPIYQTMDYLTDMFTMKPARGRINLSWVNDSALEALLDKQRTQLKAEERVQTFRQIEELVAEQQYHVYYSTSSQAAFWDSDIQNFRPPWFPSATNLMRLWRG